MADRGHTPGEELRLVAEAIRQRDAAIDALDPIRCALVIPWRSVDRVRSAVADGRDPEIYLDDIESGIAQAEALIAECETFRA